VMVWCHVGTDNLPRTVLVVKDEVPIRSVIAEHLREYGYRVVKAGSGDKAIQLLRTAVTVNVVLSDVRMPVRQMGSLSHIGFDGSGPAPRSF
jgi:CheY-like chemotaxis protein